MSDEQTAEPEPENQELAVDQVSDLNPSGLEAVVDEHEFESSPPVDDHSEVGSSVARLTDEHRPEHAMDSAVESEADTLPDVDPQVSLDLPEVDDPQPEDDCSVEDRVNRRPAILPLCDHLLNRLLIDAGNSYDLNAASVGRLRKLLIAIRGRGALSTQRVGAETPIFFLFFVGQDERLQRLVLARYAGERLSVVSDRIVVLPLDFSDESSLLALVKDVSALLERVNASAASQQGSCFGYIDPRLVAAVERLSHDRWLFVPLVVDRLQRVLTGLSRVQVDALRRWIYTSLDTGIDNHPVIRSVVTRALELEPALSIRASCLVALIELAVALSGKSWPVDE